MWLPFLQITFSASRNMCMSLICLSKANLESIFALIWGILRYCWVWTLHSIAHWGIVTSSDDDHYLCLETWPERPQCWAERAVKQLFIPLFLHCYIRKYYTRTYMFHDKRIFYRDKEYEVRSHIAFLHWKLWAESSSTPHYSDTKRKIKSISAWLGAFAV